MRTFLMAFIFSVPLLAADGYKKQIQLSQLQHEEAKTGEVYKIRQFRVEPVDDTTAELYSYVRTEEKTVKLKVTEFQMKRLKLSADTAGSLFIRRTADGWEFLG